MLPLKHNEVNYSSSPSNTINPPLYQSQCQPRLKTQAFRLQIRNQQLSQFKSQIRDKLIQIQCIDDMLERIPVQQEQCCKWAQQLFDLYRLATSYKLEPYQCLQLYKMAQKYPNRIIMELLQIVIFKADVKTLDEMFQYDIMRLLHSTINPNLNHQKIQNYNTKNDNEFAKNVEQFNNYRQQLEIAKIGLRIIADLCQKKLHIRNYVIINHKSYKHWQSAFKRFGTDIKLQFYTALEAASVIPFNRRDQNFCRIQNSILSVFAQEKKWDLLVMNDTEVQELTCVVRAVINLFEMKSGWLITLVKSFENRINKSLFSLALDIIQDFNCLLLEHRRVTKNCCILVQKVLQFAMQYQQYSQTASTAYFIAPQDTLKLTFQLLPILREGSMIPELTQTRSYIYFLISNIIVQDKISDSTKYSLFVFDHDVHKNLLKLLANQLYHETSMVNLYELSYLLNTTLVYMPLKVIEPLVVPSQVLQSMCFRVVEGDMEDHKQTVARVKLIEGVLTFIQKMDDYNRNMSINYRKMIRDQFQQKFRQIANMFHCDEILSSRLCLLLDRLLET